MAYVITIVGFGVIVFLLAKIHIRKKRRLRREAQIYLNTYDDQWLKENLFNRHYARPAIYSKISSAQPVTDDLTNEIDDPLTDAVEGVAAAVLVSEAADLLSRSDNSEQSTNTDIFAGGDGNFGGCGASGDFE